MSQQACLLIMQRGDGVFVSVKSAVVLFCVHGNPDNCLEIIWENHGEQRSGYSIYVHIFSVSLTSCGRCICLSSVWLRVSGSDWISCHITCFIISFFLSPISLSPSHALSFCTVSNYSSSFFSGVRCEADDRTILLSDSLWEFRRMPEIL